MTNEERNQLILAAIADATERGTVSKKVARDTIINQGMYTKRGKLRAEFGGETKRRAAAA